MLICCIQTHLLQRSVHHSDTATTVCTKCAAADLYVRMTHQQRRTYVRCSSTAKQLWVLCGGLDLMLRPGGANWTALFGCSGRHIGSRLID
jgi:hypothetical protein